MKLALNPFPRLLDRLRSARPSQTAALVIDRKARRAAPKLTAIEGGAANEEAAAAGQPAAPAELLTRTGGPCPLPDHIRNHCAILSDGSFYVRESRIADHDILDAGNIAEMVCGNRLPRGKVGRPIPCDDEKLNEIYGAASLAPIKNRAAILSHFWQIVERGTSNRATEIQIRKFNGRLTVRFEVNGVLTPNVPEFELTGANCDYLFTVAHNQGDRGDPIENKEEAQERTIVKAEKLAHTPCSGIRMQTAKISGGRHLNIRPLYRKLPIEGVGLAKLGLTKRCETALYSIMNYKQGVIVISGPTASGKTTLAEVWAVTLYASFKNQKFIVFLNDPPESEHPDLTNIEVKGGVEGAGFTAGKKVLLRINPHVAGVGEARDHESATSSYQIGRTGKPCLVTIHTDRALSIPLRMIDHGVPISVVYDSQVNLAWTGQRMISCLCPDCSRLAKDEEDPRIQAIFADYRDLLGPMADQLRIRGDGCPTCRDLGERKLATPGYKGARKLYFEIVRPNKTVCGKLRDGDIWGAREYWLREMAGMESMELQAFPDLLAGKLALDDFSQEFSDLEVLQFDLELAGFLKPKAVAA